MKKRRKKENLRLLLTHSPQQYSSFYYCGEFAVLRSPPALHEAQVAMGLAIALLARTVLSISTACSVSRDAASNTIAAYGGGGGAGRGPKFTVEGFSREKGPVRDFNVLPILAKSTF
jgi:hypothetical protein